MKHSKLVGILVLSVLMVVTLISSIENYSEAPVFYTINLLILLGLTVNLIFNRKKTVDIENEYLVVKKGNRILRRYNLAQRQRIIYGYQTMKIIFQDSVETFKYSDFTEKAVHTLESLSKRNLPLRTD